METSTDRILGNRLQLMQPAEGYRAAIDPVLLAAAVAAKPGERLLDLGCGVGTAGLCVLARVPGVSVTGLDLQPALIAMATRNAAANGLSGSTFFQCGDLLTFKDGGFDHVLANPPYLAREKATLSPNIVKALANVEGDAKLADWVACAIDAVKPGGSVTFIHRADREDELRAAMSKDLGGLRLLRFSPRAGASAKRIILSGRKGAAADFCACIPWVLHGADGRYTTETQAILRDASALEIVSLA